MKKSTLALSFSLLFSAISLCSCQSEVRNTIGLHITYSNDDMTCRVGIRSGFNFEELHIGNYWSRQDEAGNEFTYRITGLYINDSAGDYFLKDNRVIRKVVIENDFITTLPYDVFRNSSLKEIDLSKATALSAIGDHVFQNSDLETIIMPPNLKRTYKGVFSASKVKNVVFPDSYVTMDVDTFFNCPNLESVNLGSGIKTISGSCFERTPSLTSVIAPETSIIASHAFRDTPSLKEFDLSKVKSIGSYSFYRSGIESVTLSNATIGDNCFRETKVKTVSLSSINTIPYKAFGDCYDLEEVELKGNIYTIGSNAFKNSKIEEISMPSTVKFVGSEAFYNCSSLKEVDFSSSLESISTNAFRKCDLANITLPSSLKRIYAGAFLETKIREVSLTSDVSLLGECFPNGCVISK